MIRAFVAVELGETIKERYASFHAEAKPTYPGIRWVRPENLHVTLKFLGDTEERLLEPLSRIVGSIAGGVPSFRLSVGGAGSFGPRRVPSVLWISLEDGAPPLASLASEIEEGVRKLGFPAEDKDWRAHITVGRNPKRIPCEGWEALVERSGLSGLSLQVEDVCLFSSRLRPEGPLYSLVWKVPLKPQT